MITQNKCSVCGSEYQYDSEETNSKNSATKCRKCFKPLITDYLQVNKELIRESPNDGELGYRVRRLLID